MTASVDRTQENYNRIFYIGLTEITIRSKPDSRIKLISFYVYCGGTRMWLSFALEYFKDYFLTISLTQMNLHIISSYE